MPEMHYVDSSNVEAIGYDPATQELHVRFLKSGETYVYYNVGPYVGSRMQGGEGQLKKYQGKRKLGDWLARGEFPHSVKVMDSWRACQEIGRAVPR